MVLTTVGGNLGKSGGLPNFDTFTMMFASAIRQHMGRDSVTMLLQCGVSFTHRACTNTTVWSHSASFHTHVVIALPARACLTSSGWLSGAT